MKRIASLLILAVFFSFFFPPSLVFAQEKVPNCCKLSRTITLDGTTYDENKTVGSEDVCSLTGVVPDYKTKDWGMLCLLSSTYVITDWIFTLLIVVAGIFVIMGAFTLVTSAGSSEKVTKGKNYILYAAIGLLVGLLAKAVPAFIRSLIG